MSGETRSRPSWREEMRQDRLTSAQIDREREAARTQARIAERQARVQIRREEDLARAGAREQRVARRADGVAWVRGHTLDLLFVPVIVVPAVLAWTAMGAYGYQLYGPPGLLLPAFSEGAMWAFAAATTLTPATEITAYTRPVTGPRGPAAVVMPWAKFSAAPTAANTTVPSRRCQIGRSGWRRRVTVAAAANAHMAPSENAGSASPAGPYSSAP